MEMKQLRRNKINYTTSTCIFQVPALPAAHNVLIKCNYHYVISFHSNHTGGPARLAIRHGSEIDVKIQNCEENTKEYVEHTCQIQANYFQIIVFYFLSSQAALLNQANSPKRQ